MTMVGTRHMIVYDDLRTREKIRIYDARVERPPHYDTFAEFQYRIITATATSHISTRKNL